MDLLIISISHFYLPLLTQFDLCRRTHCKSMKWWVDVPLNCGWSLFFWNHCLPWAAWINVKTKKSCQFRTSGGLFHIVACMYVYTYVSNICLDILYYLICTFYTSYIHIQIHYPLHLILDMEFLVPIHLQIDWCRWWAGFSDRLISATLQSPGVSTRRRWIRK